MAQVEYCIANDEGVIEDNLYNHTKAVARASELGDGSVELRSDYDENGDWIEWDENENAQ